MFAMSPYPSRYHMYIIVIVFNEAAVTMFAMSPSPGQYRLYIIVIVFNQSALAMFATFFSPGRCHAPNTFGTVNMEHTIDSSLSWSER